MKNHALIKLVLSFLTLIALRVFVFSQDLKMLDKDNGYRIFKIGLTFDKFKDSLQPLNLNNPTTTGYKFVGSDTSLQNIAGIRPFVIHILFDFSNNLVSSTAYIYTANNGRNFEKRTEKIFETLFIYYLDRYGKDYTKYSLKEDVMISGGIRYVWETEKVTFTLQMYTGKNMEWRTISIDYTKTGFFEKDGYNH